MTRQQKYRAALREDATRWRYLVELARSGKSDAILTNALFALLAPIPFDHPEPLPPEPTP